MRLARRWLGGAFLVAIFGVMALGVPAFATDSEPVVPATDLAIGGELFRAHCAACHSATGVGGALTYTVNAPPLSSFSAVTIASAIRGGPGDMPNFGPGVLNDRELHQVVTYTVYLKDPFDRGGAPIGRVGPMMEGLVAWLGGVVALVLATMWLGDRRA